MKHGGCVYIVTNQYNNVLYTGVTAELRARKWKHKTNCYPKSFTAKYKCNKIVWYQIYSRIEEAIDREKQIKNGNRKHKESLIKAINSTGKTYGTIFRICRTIQINLLMSFESAVFNAEQSTQQSFLLQY